jgi:hypothetical protein
VQAALTLLLVQGALGAFDTLYYHEYREQLPRHRAARVELRLHAARDFAYAALFGTLAWWKPCGVWAMAVLALMLFEILITLWDFIEEDRSRKLPAGERVMHTIMAIVYGAFLACLLPQLIAASFEPTALMKADYGWVGLLMTAMSLGVCGSGVRDVAASFRRVT